MNPPPLTLNAPDASFSNLDSPVSLTDEFENANKENIDTVTGSFQGPTSDSSPLSIQQVAPSPLVTGILKKNSSYNELGKTTPETGPQIRFSPEVKQDDAPLSLKKMKPARLPSFNSYTSHIIDKPESKRSQINNQLNRPPSTKLSLINPKLLNEKNHSNDEEVKAPSLSEVPKKAAEFISQSLQKADKMAMSLLFPEEKS